MQEKATGRLIFEKSVVPLIINGRRKKVRLSKLVASQNHPEPYKITYYPTLADRIKSLFGLFPTKKQIEDAVRRDMFGENV